MLYFVKFYVLVVMVILTIKCDSFSENKYVVNNETRINGLTFVAPPKPYNTLALPTVKQTGANWIAVVPYAYHKVDNPNIKYNLDRQWWGETKKGVFTTVNDAKNIGLHVMLKPQVYIPGGFTGNVNWSSVAQWKIWESSYKKFIIDFAILAEEAKVDLFCIGTEYKTAVIERPEFWKELIAAVKQVYSGKLTYAANWDEFTEVSFWKELDYIGVNAYFELSDEETPAEDVLTEAWQKYLPMISAEAKKNNRPILFTEYGYLSVDNCAGKNWLLQENLEAKKINENCQLNAIKALHNVFGKQPFWAGSFLWKWFPNKMGHEGYFKKDYTPQGKKTEKVLTEIFKN